MEQSEKNMEKYEIYKTMHDNLNKAMRSGFYYEAIFIEYAILEDRLASLLKHAGIPWTDKDGRDIAINKKLTKVKGRPEFTAPDVRKRIPLALLEEIEKWIVSRNDLIHHLANIPYDSDSVRETAVQGEALMKQLKAKSDSVNRYFQRSGRMG